MNKTLNQIIKSHILLTVLTVVAGLLMTVGVAYAFIRVDPNIGAPQTVTLGTLNADIRSTASEPIILNDLVPQEESELDDTINKKFEFVIENTGSLPFDYILNLKDNTANFKASNTSYNNYKNLSEDHYGYIRYKFDNGEAKSLDMSVSNGEFVLSTGTLSSGANETHTIQFWIDASAPNSIQGSILSLDLTMNAVQKEKTFVDILLSKANTGEITDYNSGNKGEMYTFSHEATEQTGALTDYRYIGANPNNYVIFNNETWRIIGVFEVDGELRVKVMRNESIGNMQWNENGTNNWVNSTLNSYLNEDYYNGLSVTARNQVASSTWYLGTGTWGSNKDGSVAYTMERSNTVGSASGSVKSTIGNIGLIYPSDYIYTYANGVDKTCFDNSNSCYYEKGTLTSGWIYNSLRNLISNFYWLASPNMISSSYAFSVTYVGCVSESYHDFSYKAGVTPVAYLKSDIKTTSGDGTSGSPYTLQQMA